jgi:hypothetical protein
VNDLWWLWAWMPLLFWLLGAWWGYEHGKERGFEECRQKWLDQIWENVDRITRKDA